jgi:hypothetical protein
MVFTRYGLEVMLVALLIIGWAFVMVKGFDFLETSFRKNANRKTKKKILNGDTQPFDPHIESTGRLYSALNTIENAAMDVKIEELTQGDVSEAFYYALIRNGMRLVDVEDTPGKTLR